MRLHPVLRTETIDVSTLAFFNWAVKCSTGKASECLRVLKRPNYIWPYFSLNISGLQEKTDCRKSRQNIFFFSARLEFHLAEKLPTFQKEEKSLLEVSDSTFISGDSVFEDSVFVNLSSTSVLMYVMPVVTKYSSFT